MAKFLIIFGSTGGNTELTCYKIREVLEENGHTVALQRAENSAPTDILGVDAVILASPTYGHGLLQEHMQVFVSKFNDLSILRNKKFAIVGLGDDKYDRYHNIESARILNNFVEVAGGEFLIEALTINKNPIHQIHSTITSWSINLSHKLS